jgi:hypothetical protein
MVRFSIGTHLSARAVTSRRALPFSVYNNVIRISVRLASVARQCTRLGIRVT